MHVDCFKERGGERGEVGRGDELCVCQIIKLQGIIRKDFFTLF